MSEILNHTVRVQLRILVPCGRCKKEIGLTIGEEANEVFHCFSCGARHNVFAFLDFYEHIVTVTYEEEENDTGNSKTQQEARELVDKAHQWEYTEGYIDSGIPMS